MGFPSMYENICERYYNAEPLSRWWDRVNRNSPGHVNRRDVEEDCDIDRDS